MYLGPFVVQVRVGYTFQRHPISGLIDSAGGLLHKTMVWGTAHSKNLIKTMVLWIAHRKNLINNNCFVHTTFPTPYKHNGFGHDAFQTPYKKQWFGAHRIPATL